MSCIGVDLGTSRAVIAVARNRGVDTICNEVSNRATPCMVTFGPKSRFLGEAAKTQEISSFRSTVCNLRRLIGLSASVPEDFEFFNVERLFINCPITLCDDSGVQVEVSFLGEQRTFSAVEVLAMFIGRIRDIAHAEVKIPVQDMVLAVPAYFNERQRRALQDAAAIAGVNITRMISEPMAIALSYGMPRGELVTEESSERLVCFIDVGFATTTISVAAFAKGKAEIKVVTYDSRLGGRDFDALLASYFTAELNSKGTSLDDNAKARFRLRAACERAKKILSANQIAMLNVENLAADRDFSSSITRVDFEQLISPLMARLQAVILGAFKNVDISSIHSVEMVGGSTRIPAIRDLIRRIFGKEPCTTLNQDEAIAKGCALQSALLSPTFKVKEYSVADINLIPRIFAWNPVDAEDEGEALAFPTGNSVPSTKLLTFSPRPLPFEVSAHFIQNEQRVLIGTTRVEASVVPEEPQSVKLKVRLNPSHLVSFEGVSWAPDANNTSNLASSTLKLVSCVENLNLPKAKMNILREREVDMAANDKLVADTAERKNALEEYIYDMRNKLDAESGSLVKFASPEEADSILSLCAETEEWLYCEEGEDASKSVYVSKLEALKKKGEPIIKRAVEFEERPAAENLLREAIAEYLEKAASPLFEYLGPEDLKKLVSACQKSQEWIDDQVSIQSKHPLHLDPVLTCQKIKAERDKLLSIVVPIVSKPRPKPSTPTGPQPSPTSSQNEHAKSEATGEKPTQDQQPSMDFDDDKDGAENTEIHNGSCCGMDCDDFEHCSNEH